MPLTIEQLRAQRDALLADLGASEEIRFQDRSVRLRSVDEIRRSLALIEAELAKVSGMGASSTLTVQTERGI